MKLSITTLILAIVLMGSFASMAQAKEKISMRPFNVTLKLEDEKIQFEWASFFFQVAHVTQLGKIIQTQSAKIPTEWSVQTADNGELTLNLAVKIKAAAINPYTSKLFESTYSSGVFKTDITYPGAGKITVYIAVRNKKWLNSDITDELVQKLEGKTLEVLKVNFSPHEVRSPRCQYAAYLTDEEGFKTNVGLANGYVSCEDAISVLDIKKHER